MSVLCCQITGPVSKFLQRSLDKPAIPQRVLTFCWHVVGHCNPRVILRTLVPCSSQPYLPHGPFPSEFTLPIVVKVFNKMNEILMISSQLTSAKFVQKQFPTSKEASVFL